MDSLRNIYYLEMFAKICGVTCAVYDSGKLVEWEWKTTVVIARKMFMKIGEISKNELNCHFDRWVFIQF